MEWFVAREGQAVGPMSFQDLVAAARQGQLGKQDLVWRTGMEDWVPAAAVKGIWPPPLPVHVTEHPHAQEQPVETQTAVPRPARGEHVNKGLDKGKKILWSVLVFVVGLLAVGGVKDVFGPSFERIAAVVILQMAMLGLLFYIWTRSGG